MFGTFKDLPLGGAACSRFLLGLLPTPVLHFALAESHGGIVVEWAGCQCRAALIIASRPNGHSLPSPKRHFRLCTFPYTGLDKQRRYTYYELKILSRYRKAIKVISTHEGPLSTPSLHRYIGGRSNFARFL
jgi:hypothetical protein